MKYLPTLAIVAALTFAGCAAQASLKESCTALGVVLAEFGQVAPTTERYAEYVPKVKAISDAGDAATKTALQPLIAALDKGAQGDDAMGTIGALAAATLTLMPQCANAGAPLDASTPSPSASSSPSPSPTSTLLDTRGFKVALHELGRKCTGSTCVVQVRAAVGYTGADDLAATTTVTYKVYGGVEDVVRTVTLDADGSAVEEFSVTAAKGSELYARASRVEQPL